VDGHHFTELVGTPERGRVFVQALRVGLADCAPSARMRLDALARWLQDVAYADVDDAGLAQRAVWVVRRTRFRIERFPRFGEYFTARTYCSGLGRMWAERRTSLARAGETRNAAGRERSGEPESDIEAVSLWVHLDPASWRPMPFSDEEIAAYGDAADGRRVTARLHHPAPGPVNEGTVWTFRATECDIAGHVNNAAYWAPLEEELVQNADPERLDAELEYRTPCQPGDKQVLRSANQRWIVGGEGAIHASLVFT
jgi:acyl-ACP thioesterase